MRQGFSVVSQFSPILTMEDLQATSSDIALPSHKQVRLLGLRVLLAKHVGGHDGDDDLCAGSTQVELDPT